MAVLEARYALPRLPLEVRVQTLPRLRPWTLVSVVGRYAPAVHPELANFDGMMLQMPAGEEPLLPNQLYRVVGFYLPGVAPGMPPVVGFSGPSLRALSVHDLWFSCPCTTAGKARFQAVVHAEEDRWAEHGAVLRALDAGRSLVVLTRGYGGQKTGEWAVDVVREALRLLFESPREWTTPEPEPGAGSWNVDRWVERLLDRRPLPAEAGAMLEAIAERIGAVHTALNEKHYALMADGVLACLSGSEVTVVRRGLARVYRVRGEEVTLLLREHTVGVEAKRAGANVVPETAQVALSAFDARGAEAALAEPLDVRPGDRVVFLSGHVVSLPDEALARTFVHRDIAAIAGAIEATAAPPVRSSWGVLTLDLP